MKNELKNFRHKLFFKAFGINFSLFRNTYSLHQITKILHSLSAYYPYTSSALDPLSLNLVLNDIVINTRKSIVELGSGISTLAIAQLLKINQIEATFHSIEEDKAWAEYLMSCLAKEGLSDYCTIHHISVQSSTGGELWYDQSRMDQLKQEIKPIDCLLIDGPIAYAEGKQLIRQGSEHLFDTLADRYAIFLDDTNRPGEQKIVGHWNKKYGYTFNPVESISYYIHGTHFNIG